MRMSVVSVTKAFLVSFLVLGSSLVESATVRAAVTVIKYNHFDGKLFYYYQNKYLKTVS